MGTNNLTTKSNGETVIATDPNQYKEALTNDLVPRNTAGAATDGGGDLGSATYGWGNLHLGNMTLQPDGLVDGSVDGGDITMAGARRLYINDTTIADHTIGTFDVSGVGIYAIIIDIAGTGSGSDISNYATWSIKISGLPHNYNLTGKILQNNAIIMSASTILGSFTPYGGYYTLPAFGSETITLTADYYKIGSGSISAIDCKIYIKELI